METQHAPGAGAHEVERLRQEVCRLRRGQYGLGVLVLSLLCFGLLAATRMQQALVPEVISAKSFVVVNEFGDTRAEIGLNEQGTAGLFLRDDYGILRGAFTHDNEQTKLFLYDKDETTRVGIAHFAHGGSGVALHGPGSKGAAVLYLKEEGTLTFFDEEGNELGRFPK